MTNTAELVRFAGDFHDAVNNHLGKPLFHRRPEGRVFSFKESSAAVREDDRRYRQQVAQQSAGATLRTAAIGAAVVVGLMIVL